MNRNERRDYTLRVCERRLSERQIMTYLGTVNTSIWARLSSNISFKSKHLGLWHVDFDISSFGTAHF